MSPCVQLASTHDCGYVYAGIDELCSFLDREQWHLCENPEQLKATYPNMNATLVRTLCLPDA